MDITAKIDCYLPKLILKEAQGDYTIMDMGRSYKLNIEMEGSDGRPTKEIPRYAAWRMSGNIAKEVVYTSNDLKMLQKKYNVDDKHVFKIK